ncbi:MAG: UDP-N-acetylmuramate--L-alanine ligase [Bacteroidetes bacterium]|nr:MAG: UDP-N-acetylmuramate--L-alanine ligase [Bacteroidota bacterium]TAG90077.1 MAG: UDP-N-acetylmuramate--L-alanine ligase [Bacteroidota bacterium]
MLNQFKNIYLIGIGGIGMSALARWFKLNKYWVGGYDRNPSMLTQQLINEGIEIHFEDDLKNIPDFIKHNQQESLIIYTAAISSEDNIQLQFFENQAFNIKKRAEVLGLLTQNHFTVAVAGTHGKTTTSSMIAHILTQANMPCTAFLGGILKNYQSNLLLSNEKPEKTIMVVEADEYDKSFLHLSPNISVITSIDADHLDIYGNAENVAQTFQEFALKNKKEGIVFIKKGTNLTANAKKFQYAGQYQLEENENLDFYADFINISNGYFYFDFVNKNISIENVKLGIVGYHNIENAVAALAVCLALGVAPDLVKRGIESFEGAKRRFDFLKRDEKNVIIDDYAHHPTELNALLTSARALYPNKKITIVFQPHLFSRTKDFMQSFADSLSLADEVILLEIYAAREKPIENITSKNLLQKINIPLKKVLSKEEVLIEIKKNPREVLIFAGAGDIDKVAMKSIY